MDYKKSNQLESLVRDKRVAFVGPSKHLVDKNLGGFIDKHDVVCRVNYVAANGFEKDYGNRTDVFFYNCATLDTPQMTEQFDRNEPTVKKIKLAVCPVVKALGSDKWMTWSDDYVSPVVDNFKKINKYSIPFHWIGIPNYRMLYNTIGTEPNSGTVSIAVLLQHSMKELFITGISFYSQPGGYESIYFDTYHSKQFRNKGYNGLGSHQQPPQQAFLKKQLQFHADRITLDSHLNNVLKLNYNKVVEL